MLTGSIKGHKVGPALLSKMVDNLTFVTAYYKIYDDSDNTEYIDYFLKWADKGANRKCSAQCTYYAGVDSVGSLVEIWLPNLDIATILHNKIC